MGPATATKLLDALDETSDRTLDRTHRAASRPPHRRTTRLRRSQPSRSQQLMVEGPRPHNTQEVFATNGDIPIDKLSYARRSPSSPTGRGPMDASIIGNRMVATFLVAIAFLVSYFVCFALNRALLAVIGIPLEMTGSARVADYGAVLLAFSIAVLSYKFLRRAKYVAAVDPRSLFAVQPATDAQAPPDERRGEATTAPAQQPAKMHCVGFNRG